MTAQVGAGSFLPAPFCLGLGLLLACGSPDQHAAAVPLAKLSPALRALLNDSQAQHVAHRVILDLTTQLDLTHLDDSLRSVAAGRAARRQAVTTALRGVADASQSRLIPLLERLRRRGDVAEYERFIIVNRFVVGATPAGIRALAAAPEVATISEETPRRASHVPGVTCPPAHLVRDIPPWPHRRDLRLFYGPKAFLTAVSQSAQSHIRTSACRARKGGYAGSGALSPPYGGGGSGRAVPGPNSASPPSVPSTLGSDAPQGRE